jgi:hypothetical protein
MDSVMAQFKAFSPNVEVNGQTVLSVVNGMGAMASSKKMALSILESNGIIDPNPDGWYSQKHWLDAFNEISDQVGPRTLFLIGKCIPKNASFPPGIDTLHKALISIDKAYHMNHRGGEIGNYNLTQFDSEARHVTMICTNLYPCDYDCGIIDQMCQEFKPAGVGLVKVIHDDSKSCRKSGEESCTYNITW